MAKRQRRDSIPAWGDRPSNPNPRTTRAESPTHRPAGLEGKNDSTVEQLKLQRIVSTEILENLLADDGPNFRMTLADAGRQVF